MDQTLFAIATAIQKDQQSQLGLQMELTETLKKFACVSFIRSRCNDLLTKVRNLSQEAKSWRQ
jgi:hypothetical protein